MPDERWEPEAEAEPPARREPDPFPEPPPTPRRTTKRRAVGLASAIALGFKEVFEPERREEIVQEIDASGEPDRDAPVELLYIKDQPRDSRARVRPWLFKNHEKGR